MGPVTKLLDSVACGNMRAAEQLLPLVYDELRRLAASKLAHETPGQTLQPTALVHEAYLRLVGDAKTHGAWNHKGHFFAAAAEAMQRILIESARRKGRQRHGGGRTRVNFEHFEPDIEQQPDDLLDLEDALARLEAEDSVVAKIAQLRLFAGLSVEEAGAALDIPRATAFRHWTYARAWLAEALQSRADQ
jgi:RNA polymerase sigma factor (TIGR02999 family)